MNDVALRLAGRIFDKPLIENQYRSAFVEEMVEPYLRSYGWRYTGDSWGGWDFERDDSSRLEIKQSAAHQTWSDARHIRTRGSFDIAERKGYFHEGGSKWVAERGRCAQTYVFAWNSRYGRDTDHRDPTQWEFYVLPTATLPETQKTISLSRIKALSCPHGSTRIAFLGERIEQVTPRLVMLSP
jgi:hypothetical protein